MDSAENPLSIEAHFIANLQIFEVTRVTLSNCLIFLLIRNFQLANHLAPGHLAFQTYGAENHAGWIKFQLPFYTLRESFKESNRFKKINMFDADLTLRISV